MAYDNRFFTIWFQDETVKKVCSYIMVMKISLHLLFWSVGRWDYETTDYFGVQEHPANKRFQREHAVSWQDSLVTNIEVAGNKADHSKAQHHVAYRRRWWVFFMYQIPRLWGNVYQTLNNFEYPKNSLSSCGPMKSSTPTTPTPSANPYERGTGTVALNLWDNKWTEIELTYWRESHILIL